ncbi:glycosyltransferase family 2 protein [Pandoraea pulmonicola]|uniref:Chondroitin polymerase n=1 Tax=Pandoraea pulmonicola TaxID=93221 RepID=A0AAJ4ZB06_PANPU|nr:glycosyltransferase [Pandoraea pulmonicola]AJC21202.1 hypothetical protein RO07_13235 [Pandoraea pulmonicola]SUA90119.1 Chondroitin polymerase [Pandoraea pulmonicola]
MYPEISVVVPTYKRPEKLLRALASVEEACHLPYEVTVVDDCPDGSAFEVAREFKAKYVWKAGSRRGMSQSRNIGIQMASGNYVMFLDDDDFLSPGGIDALHEVIVLGNTFVFGNYSMMFVQGTAPTTDLSGVQPDHMLINNQIPVGAYLMTRSAIRRGFDERMRSHEDWEFLLCNMDWRTCRHVPFDVVTIDKTENRTTSTSARRRAHFGLDYLSVYSRYPAPGLSVPRRDALARLGANVDATMLALADDI